MLKIPLVLSTLLLCISATSLRAVVRFQACLLDMRGRWLPNHHISFIFCVARIYFFPSTPSSRGREETEKTQMYVEDPVRIGACRTQGAKHTGESPHHQRAPYLMEGLNPLVSWLVHPGGPTDSVFYQFDEWTSHCGSGLNKMTVVRRN